MTAREIIEKIQVVPSNLEHIIKTGKINGSLLIDIENAMESYAKQHAAAQQWIYTEPPKDRPIIRWHKLWKCPISVKFSDQPITSKGFCWREETLTHEWPEASFTENVWAEITPPKQNT